MLKPGEREVYSRNANRKRVARTHMDQKGNITTDADGNITATAGKNYGLEAVGDINNTAGGKFYFGNNAEDLRSLLLGIIDLIDGHTDTAGQTTNPLYVMLQTLPFRDRVNALLK